jgi:hypothetical protein
MQNRMEPTGARGRSRSAHLRSEPHRRHPDQGEAGASLAPQQNGLSAKAQGGTGEVFARETRRDLLGHGAPIAKQGPGEFIAEVGQIVRPAGVRQRPRDR